jgi:hypothetical protein
MMKKEELIKLIRDAKKDGRSQIDALLSRAVRGVKHITLKNLDGRRNGNPHDIWVDSRSGKKTIGRIYLGSRNIKANTEGWESLILEVNC